MSTYAQLAAKPGVGSAFYLAITFDRSTFSHYYGTHVVPLVDSDARIVSLSPFIRSFGDDYGMTSASFTVQFDNSDGVLDWIVDQDQWATKTSRAQWHLVSYLYDPQNTADYSTKTLGVFTMKDPPRQDGAVIEVLLGEQVYADIQLADLPTYRDWIAATDANRPSLFTAPAGQQIDPSITGAVPGLDLDSPIPLAFGSRSVAPQRFFRNAYMVCAVAGSSSGMPAPVSVLVLGNNWSATASSSGSYTIPVAQLGNYQYADYELWKARRSADITKNGKTWHLIWVSFNIGLNTGTGSGATLGNVDAVYNWLVARDIEADSNGVTGAPGTTFSPAKVALLAAMADYSVHDLVAPIRVQDRLLSHPTDNVSSLTPYLALTILQDLVTSYARSSPTIDATAFSRMKLARPTCFAAGSVVPGVSKSIGFVTTVNGRSPKAITTTMTGELLEEIRSLASASNVDVFVKWDGSLSVSAPISDYTSQTVTVGELDEALCARVSVRVPAIGQRGAPFNRLYIESDGDLLGPLDDATAIASWKRVVSRTIDGRWAYEGVAPNDAALDISSRWGGLGGSTVRPRLELTTALNGLNYELGDYITLAWSQFGFAAGTVWRVEAIRPDLLNGVVGLELAWADDLRSTGNLPYVLDDETLSTRVSATFGRTVTLVTGDDTITFASGSLLTDGVAAGDHLIVQDSTEDADVFARNVALLIASVTDATHLEINPTYSSNAFGSGGPFVLTTWEIRRGALTYRSNATVYGKIGDSTQNGYFSNGSSAAYKLLDG